MAKDVPVREKSKTQAVSVILPCCTKQQLVLVGLGSRLELGLGLGLALGLEKMSLDINSVETQDA